MPKTKWDGAEKPTINHFFKIDSLVIKQTKIIRLYVIPNFIAQYYAYVTKSLSNQFVDKVSGTS